MAPLGASLAELYLVLEYWYIGIYNGTWYWYIGILYFTVVCIGSVRDHLVGKIVELYPDESTLSLVAVLAVLLVTVLP